MSKHFIIQWKSKVNGRAGKGTKFFDREEAERLAAELNRGYPDIQHEPLPAESPGLTLGAPRGSSAGEPAESEPDDTTTNPIPLFSSR